MFTTPRLRLRAVTREDLAAFVRWFNDPDVTQFLSRIWPLSMEEEEDWFQRVLSRPRWERPLSIEVREGRAWVLIGTVGFSKIDWLNRWAELGIAIGEKAYWDQGYGTEAVQAMVAIAFTLLNLNRVQLEVYEFNHRGRKAYEKVGFRLEGRRRQARYLGGRYHDSLIMAVLREEWEPPEWWPFSMRGGQSAVSMQP